MGQDQGVKTWIYKGEMLPALALKPDATWAARSKNSTRKRWFVLAPKKVKFRKMQKGECEGKPIAAGLLRWVNRIESA